MFGSDSNKNNPSGDAAVVQPVNQSSPPPELNNKTTDTTAAEPAVAPGTAVAPTAPLLDDSTAHYLDSSNKIPSTATLDASSSFLETSSGTPTATSIGSAPPAPSVTPAGPAAAEALTKIKMQALQSLAPLIDHLQQSPEERFKTLMMMIQASDNPEYLDEAYAAANQITDEKVRAQALLDVVNEINYFTQNHPPNTPA